MNILFVSLGCDKNLVDTEVMLGLLASRGHQMVDTEDMADVIVVNTCCFIHDAKEESIQAILEMAEYRKQGSCKALIVTGCLAGYNAGLMARGEMLLTLRSEATAIGALLHYKNPDGSMFTFAGDAFFDDLKEKGLYTTDKSIIRRRIQREGLAGIYNAFL